MKNTIILIMSLIYFNTYAQSLSNKEIKQVIHATAEKLQQNYVFPDVGKEMADALKLNLKSDKYSNLNSSEELAHRMTSDLQKICNDLHLKVIYSPKAQYQDKQNEEENFSEQMKRKNYGFLELKILDGNIGYVNLVGFAPIKEAKETAVAAMNFLSNADAIIFDLRNNGGGDPEMIRLLTTYLYEEGQKVHLNNFYYRPEDEFTESWTLDDAPGKRNPIADIYILTSSRTFSAAEEFSYNLLQLNKATIIGEVTGGGAHPGGLVRITDNFEIWVPTGRAINPISKTNWEGTGVQPHINVLAKKAFDTAYTLSLETIYERTQAQYLSDIIKRIEEDNKPRPIINVDISRYCGTYTMENGGPQFTFEIIDDSLYGQMKGDPSKIEFKIIDNYSFRGVSAPVEILFKENSSGKVESVTLTMQGNPPMVAFKVN